MGGGNLSLQVHPLTSFIREKFGVSYTQDESYYMLDAEPDAVVYLGLKEGIDRKQMEQDLRVAQTGKYSFPAEKYVNTWPVKKHSHVSIPAGTIHCSGRNGMVLEISATPYIFTFKLWDWDRLGLDGKPRPIHLDYGIANIQWDRTTEWVRKNLVNPVQPIASGPGWREESTGLYKSEFIETQAALVYRAGRARYAGKFKRVESGRGRAGWWWKVPRAHSSRSSCIMPRRSSFRRR